MMKSEKKEMILQTIDQFQVVSVKQLHEILNLGSYRYTCKLIQELEEYLVVERTKQKKIYLNERGKEFIGSTTILSLDRDYFFENEVYLFFKKPSSWKKDVEIALQPSLDGIKVNGLKVVAPNKIKVPAIFQNQDYLCFIEMDTYQTMKENEERINWYKELFHSMREEKYMLFYMTKTEGRKRRLEELLENIVSEVIVIKE